MNVRRDQCDGPEPTSDDATTTEQILDAIGVVFSILWIGVLIYGWNENWLKHVPLIGLAMLLIGFILAKHFVYRHFTHRLRILLQHLLSRQRASVWRLVLSAASFALIGGIGMWVVIRPHATEAVAAGAAVFGTALFGLMPIAIANQRKELPPDQLHPKEFANDDCGSQ